MSKRFLDRPLLSGVAITWSVLALGFVTGSVSASESMTVAKHQLPRAIPRGIYLLARAQNR